MVTVPISTASHTPTKTFVTGIPQTIGIVLQPHFASPNISSMSLITSRIREIIKAKPVYKNESFKSLGVTKSPDEIVVGY